MTPRNRARSYTSLPRLIDLADKADLSMQRFRCIKQNVFIALVT